MASLRPAHGAPDVILTAEHTVGRSAACRLRLTADAASSQHAVLRWTGEAWEIRDLGSRNGTRVVAGAGLAAAHPTRVGGVALLPGTPRILALGDALSFGSAASWWTVVDLSPPEPAARHRDGHWQGGEGGLLLLGQDGRVEACIYEEGGDWILEAGEERRLILDGEIVAATGGPWTVFLPEPVTGTREDGSPLLDLDEAELVFSVSRDEEHVELALRSGPVSVQLPHRSHLYIVLHLARARLAEPHLAEAERGWCYQDDLIRDHRIPLDQFNVVLFRARRQLRQAGILGADRLIERRRGSGQLRLGTGRVRVQPL